MKSHGRLAGQPSLLLLATVSVLASMLTGSLSLSLAPITLDELRAGSSGYGAVGLTLGIGATLRAMRLLPGLRPAAASS